MALLNRLRTAAPISFGMTSYYAWALAEKTLASVPKGKALYHGVGSVVNRGRRGLRGNSPSSLRMIGRARAFLPRDGVAVEVGSGWFNREAFLIYLLDLDTTVYLFDIEDKAQLVDVRTYLGDLLRHAATVADRLDMSEAEVRQKIEPLLALDSLEAIYAACGFHPVIVAPDRVSFLPPDSVDVMVSNCVLNHIPPRILVPELRALGVMLRQSGRMIHVLGHEDHWTFRAPSVNRFNFYRYSDAYYARWFESLEYHNRMVKAEWLTAFDLAGLAVESWEPEVTEKSLAEIDALPSVASRFARTPRADLASIKTTVTLRRAS